MEIPGYKITVSLENREMGEPFGQVQFYASPNPDSTSIEETIFLSHKGAIKTTVLGLLFQSCDFSMTFESALKPETEEILFFDPQGKFVKASPLDKKVLEDAEMAAEWGISKESLSVHVNFPINRKYIPGHQVSKWVH